MLNLKNILFGKKKGSQKLLDFLKTLPGPSPWGLRAGQKVFGEFEWEDAGDKEHKAGKILLLNAQKQPILVVDFYNYVMKLSASKVFIWWQCRENKDMSGPVRFTLLDLDKLEPLNSDLDSLCNDERLKSDGILFDGQPAIKFELSSLLVDKEVEYQFPEQIKHLGELFVLCNSTGIRVADYKVSNLGLMVLNLKEDKFRIYPQEWFNNGNHDFGYEWVTKVGREPESGEIVGGGVRIRAFVLLSDYSGIKKYF